MTKENANVPPTPEAATPNPMGLFGDMSLLREIIMGPKIIEYNERFSEKQTLIEQNDAATKAHFEALERDMNARFDRLEQLLAQNVEKLTKFVQETSKNDKTMLADLLVGVSQKLKG